MNSFHYSLCRKFSIPKNLLAGIIQTVENFPLECRKFSFLESKIFNVTHRKFSMVKKLQNLPKFVENFPWPSAKCVENFLSEKVESKIFLGEQKIGLSKIFCQKL